MNITIYKAILKLKWLFNILVHWVFSFFLIFCHFLIWLSFKPILLLATKRVYNSIDSSISKCIRILVLLLLFLMSTILQLHFAYVLFYFFSVFVSGFEKQKIHIEITNCIGFFNLVIVKCFCKHFWMYIYIHYIQCMSTIV